MADPRGFIKVPREVAERRPVTDRAADYCAQQADQLRQQGFRVEVDGRKTKIEKITGNTFDIDTNASGAVTQVVRTEVSRQGTTEVSIYSDANSDQRFDKTFEIEVAGANAHQLEQHRFTFDSVHLSDGVQFIVVVIGLFSVSEILLMLESTSSGGDGRTNGAR